MQPCHPKWILDRALYTDVLTSFLYAEVMPLKKEKIGVVMQPFYADRWLARKSIRGELPVYVALEDCGNRGFYESCPSKFQVSFVSNITRDWVRTLLFRDWYMICCLGLGTFFAI